MSNSTYPHPGRQGIAKKAIEYILVNGGRTGGSRDYPFENVEGPTFAKAMVGKVEKL